MVVNDIFINMRTYNEINNIFKLKESGLNNCQISRELNIPRTTIASILKREPKEKIVINPYNYIKDNSLESAYSYILGLYLGDGYISKTKRTYRLRIFLDSQYNKLNEYLVNQLQQLFPNNKVTIIKSKHNMIILSVYSNNIPDLFPHIGKGKKHNREIIITFWQEDILISHQLIKGFIHSDGTYYFSGKFDRYEFKNLSIDILNIFKNYCDKLNIKYTSNKNVITFYKRNEVLELKELIGTKTDVI